MNSAKKSNLFGLIGEECKVSPGTVTLSLQDSPRISGETKQRIYIAARKAGYRASKIRGEKDLCFAVIHGSTESEASFFHPINLAFWYGITQAVGEFDGNVHAYEVDLADGKWSFSTLPAMMRRDKLDGVILTGRPGREFLCFLQEIQLPAVMAGPSEVATPIDQIYFDFRRGARQAVEILVAAGKKRIAFTSQGFHSEINQLLFDGYSSAMKRHGLFDDTLMAVTDTCSGDVALLDGLWASRPEVVFTTSGNFAGQVALSAALAGVRPSDGLEILACTIEPRINLRYPLHLISPDAVGLGKAAVTRLQERRRNPDARPFTLLLACEVEMAD